MCITNLYGSDVSNVHEVKKQNIALSTLSTPATSRKQQQSLVSVHTNAGATEVKCNKSI